MRIGGKMNPLFWDEICNNKNKRNLQYELQILQNKMSTERILY